MLPQPGVLPQVRNPVVADPRQADMPPFSGYGEGGPVAVSFLAFLFS
jgi:hypothetical protein